MFQKKIEKRTRDAGLQMRNAEAPTIRRASLLLLGIRTVCAPPRFFRVQPLSASPAPAGEVLFLIAFPMHFTSIPPTSRPPFFI